MDRNDQSATVWAEDLASASDERRKRSATWRRGLPVLPMLFFLACGGSAGPLAEAQTGTLPTEAPASEATPTSESAAPDAGSVSDATAPVDADATPPADLVSPPPYPVVLLHGMGGVDNFALSPLGEAYWPKVIPALAAEGETRVFATEVSPFNTSDVRAAELEVQLKAILVRTGASKVNLVAHSQGGIDARVLASPAGRNFAAHIASITTISTPHRGTKVADLALAAVPGGFVDQAISGLLGNLQRSAADLQDPQLRAQLRQLSTSYMVDVFNPTYPDAPGVRYESYAGRSNRQSGSGICDGSALANEPSELDEVPFNILPSALLLEAGNPSQPNDGLVTVESSKWGTFVQCLPADHTDEVGRGDSKVFDHVAFFKRLVARIRSNGF